MDEIRPPKPLVKFQDFTQFDLRVARVLECRAHPKADKLLVLKIDLGTEQRQICAGLKERCQPADLIGKLIVVANMEPRSLRGEQSQGVLLTATSGPMKERLVLIAPAQDVPPGSSSPDPSSSVPSLCLCDSVVAVSATPAAATAPHSSGTTSPAPPPAG